MVCSWWFSERIIFHENIAGRLGAPNPLLWSTVSLIYESPSSLISHSGNFKRWQITLEGIVKLREPSHRQWNNRVLCLPVKNWCVVRRAINSDTNPSREITSHLLYVMVAVLREPVEITREEHTRCVFWPPSSIWRRCKRHGVHVSDPTARTCPEKEPSKRRRIDGQRVEGIRTQGNWYEERSIDGKSARKLYHLSTDKYFMRFNPAPFYLLPVSRLFPLCFPPANRVSTSLIHSCPKVLSLTKV